MKVIVEMDAPGTPIMRVTMSRVPAINEIIRVLMTENGVTIATLFKVIQVVHNANSRREGELDAWVACAEHSGVTR